MKTEPDYAGVWVRLSAIVLDVVILSAVFFPATRVIKGTWLMTRADHSWVSGHYVTDPLCLVFLGCMFLYFFLLEGMVGATLGKRLLGLRVVGVDGGRAGLLRSLLRNVLRVVDGLPTLGLVAAVLISTSEERTRFGDRVAETRVIRV
ncbi:MAG: RDD family protein [Candidatus Eisenbacteria bacterium]